MNFQDGENFDEGEVKVVFLVKNAKTR